MRDIGNERTEQLIAEMEERIRDQYQQAADELQDKLEDYLRRFQVKDETWERMVESGEKTFEEYREWRTGQIMAGQRWRAMQEQTAVEFHNANLAARAIVTGYMPEVYAVNNVFATYAIERAGKVNTGFTIYSREAVNRLIRDNPDLLQPPGVQMDKIFSAWDAYKAGKPVDLTAKQKRAFDKLLEQGKDIRWQKGQMQSVTMQSIIQGESIPNMAKRIAQTMGETNHKATIRYARTAMTGAQSAGRQDAYKRAEELGVNLKREWQAVYDMRTRHEHRLLNGQQRGVDEPFEVDGYQIMYPGDPAAEAFLIWNCRCRTRAVVSGWDKRSAELRSDEAVGGMSYEEWLQARPVTQSITHQEDVGEGIKWKTIRDLYMGK